MMNNLFQVTFFLPLSFKIYFHLFLQHLHFSKQRDSFFTKSPITYFFRWASKIFAIQNIFPTKPGRPRQPDLTINNFPPVWASKLLCFTSKYMCKEFSVRQLSAWLLFKAWIFHRFCTQWIVEMYTLFLNCYHFIWRMKGLSLIGRLQELKSEAFFCKCTEISTQILLKVQIVPRMCFFTLHSLMNNTSNYFVIFHLSSRGHGAINEN